VQVPVLYQEYLAETEQGQDRLIVTRKKWKRKKKRKKKTQTLKYLLP